MILNEFYVRPVCCPACEYSDVDVEEYFDGEIVSCPVCGYYRQTPSSKYNRTPSYFRVTFSKSILWFVYLLRDTISFDIKEFEDASTIKTEKQFIDKCIKFIEENGEYELPVKNMIIRGCFK